MADRSWLKQQKPCLKYQSLAPTRWQRLLAEVAPLIPFRLYGNPIHGWVIACLGAAWYCEEWDEGRIPGLSPIYDPKRRLPEIPEVPR